MEDEGAGVGKEGKELGLWVGALSPFSLFAAPAFYVPVHSSSLMAFTCNLEMEAGSSCETFVPPYLTTCHRITVDGMVRPH
jgi:hypothetical protein